MGNKTKRKYLKVPAEPVGWYRILFVEGDPYIFHLGKNCPNIYDYPRWVPVYAPEETKK